MKLVAYGIARAFVWLIFRVVWRFRAIDAQKVPKSGPVIVACNHVAYLDPPALGIAVPRRVTYMAKRELFGIPLFGPLIGLLGAFPVDRGRGDMAAIRAALAVLGSGACLGIFPEGGRRGKNSEIGAPKLGVALLASMSGATVIPAFVSGTSQAKQFARVTVRFGAPLRMEPGRKASREDLAKWTGELMERIYALRETSGGH